MEFWRKLLLSHTQVLNHKESKYAMLRGYFNVIMVLIAAFYTVMDLYNGQDQFFGWYTLMIVVGIVGIWLNRNQYYLAVNIILILFSNAIVFIFADADTPYGGIYFYFIGTALTALILFGYSNLAWGFFFVLVSIGLGTLAELYDFNLVPSPLASASVHQISFLSSLIAGTLSCSFIVYFLIRENYFSEQTLERSQVELLKTTDELRKSQERFELALQGTHAGVYEWRVATNEIFISSYWKKLLGYEDHELEPMTIDVYQSLMHPEESVNVQLYMQEVMEQPKPYQNELRLRTKSGGYKWFLDSGIAKTDEAGNVIMLVGAIVDVNDRKLAEQELMLKNNQLAKTNEELDRFVYSASHDMRAPLSSLLGLIHLAEIGKPSEEQKTYLTMMKDRIHVMEGFIREVTDYSRNTRLGLSLNPVSLHTVVKDVVSNLSYAEEGRNVRVIIEIDPSLSITTDVTRVKVVLNNLISNAYKYHQPSGDRYIRVRAVVRGSLVYVAVEDNGRGIPSEHHHRIFEMFFRASEDSEGSGLGLYIVKETLQKLGGDISVQSESGKGSTFTFTLPV